MTTNSAAGSGCDLPAHIVLVGLMGSGKSTVGRLLADRFGRDLVDSDQAIKAATGQTVRELWERGGEAAYRRIESQIVIASLNSPRASVIAAPGGVVLDPKVRAALAQAFVIWLRARPETLASRVHIGDHRPLLGDNPASVLAAMASERAELYAAVSDLIVDVDDRSPQGCVDAILDHLERTGQA